MSNTTEQILTFVACVIVYPAVIFGGAWLLAWLDCLREDGSTPPAGETPAEVELKGSEVEKLESTEPPNLSTLQPFKHSTAAGGEP